MAVGWALSYFLTSKWLDVIQLVAYLIYDLHELIVGYCNCCSLGLFRSCYSLSKSSHLFFQNALRICHGCQHTEIKQTTWGQGARAQRCILWHLMGTNSMPTESSLKPKGLTPKATQSRTTWMRMAVASSPCKRICCSSCSVQLFDQVCILRLFFLWGRYPYDYDKRSTKIGYYFKVE